MNTVQQTYANPDADGSQNDYAAARFEKRISADTQIGTRLNYSVLDVDYDSNYYAPTDVQKFKKSTNQPPATCVKQ